MEQLPDKLKTSNEDVSFVLKDDSGEIKGGIIANIFWHHMHIESLWVIKMLEKKVMVVSFLKNGDFSNR